MIKPVIKLDPELELEFRKLVREGHILPYSKMTKKTLAFIETWKRTASRLEMTKTCLEMWRRYPSDEFLNLVQAMARAEWGANTAVRVLTDQRIEIENFDGRIELL